MDIQLPCEKCGHALRFPRDQAGRVGQCTRCGNDIYIPTPEDELEELPLTPEDQSEERLRSQLDAERRELDRILAREKGDEKGAAAPPPGGRRPAPAGPGRTTVRGVVLSYLTAMRDSDLEQAERAIALVATRRDDVIRFLDQLAADQIPPAEMSGVPPAVYQGFLKSLRARL